MPRARKSTPFTHPDEVRVVHEPDVKRALPETLAWWEAPSDKAHLAVIATVNQIESDQHVTTALSKLYESMYGDNRDGMGRASYLNRWQGAANNNSAKLSINVVQSCIDTLASKISSNKPKPQFVPNEGDWKLYSKAKMATDYLEGIFDSCRVYQLAQRMFTDALIYGTSGLYVNSKFNKLNVEYIMRDEIYVDELDGHNEEPMQLHLKRFVSRQKLIKMYPKHKDAIKRVHSVKTDAHNLINHSVSDMIVCVESWHLPTSEDSNDGKYCMTVENATLELSEYKHSEFPVVFFRPYHTPHKFWGRGLAETLFTLQLALNRLLKTIQIAQDQVAKPNVLIENGSQVNTDTINDLIGQIIFYTGTPPVFQAPEPMPASVYQWVQYLEEHAYQISGISQSAAAGEKPKDVESAVAMETVADIEAGRFENMSINWNDYFMRIAKVVMFVSQDLYTKNPKLVQRFKRDNLVRQISWKGLDWDADKFGIQLFPINRLPHDPSGRLDVVERYVQAGWFDQITGMSLLDMPDVSEETSMVTSSLHLVNQMISTMLDDGEPVEPIEQMDLALARNRAKLAIVYATLKKYPPEHIQLVINFDDSCKSMMDFMVQQQQQEQAAMQQQAAAAQPLARPEKTPRSPLLPNAPAGPANPPGPQPAMQG